MLAIDSLVRDKVQDPPTLRQRLQSGTIRASFLTLRDPAVVGIMAAAGRDCLIIDCEHTRHSPESLEAMLLACRAWGVQSMVRLPLLDRGWIAHALDGGADGLLLPMVENVEQIIEYMSFSLYPPAGKRGYTGLSPATAYGRNKKAADFCNEANARILLGVQIETRAGLDQLEKILPQERIDLFFLGTGDLAVDLGLPGQYNHPDFQGALTHFFHICREHSMEKKSGLYGSSESLLSQGQKAGAQFLVLGSDAFFLKKGAET